jgi:hypothetical protein
MSHIAKIKSKINNLVLLKQTLDDLGIKYVEATENTPLRVKVWNDKFIEDDVKLEIKTGCTFSIGVVYNEEEKSYDFVADWWGIETYADVKQEDMMNKINQKYAYNNVLEKVRKEGYDVVTEQVDNENNIRIVARKWS